jgi:lipopolysaccharide biosynthesis glycosyltransferase
MINIAFASDDNYAVPATVAITSLLVNKKEDINLYFLYVKDNFSEENKKKLSLHTKKYNTVIHYVELNPNELLDLPVLRQGLSAYLRIFTPFLIKDIDKLLYLDSDIIVERPLDELYYTDMEEYDYAGVADLVGYCRKDYLRNIGYTFDRSYINTGVLLMNLKRLRQYDLKEIINPYVQNYKDYMIYSDQDIINCLWEKIRILPPKYNAMTPVLYKLDESPWTSEELNMARSKPYIIHFITLFKPWHFGVRHKYKFRWYHYLRLTSYSRLYSVVDRKILKELFDGYMAKLMSLVKL